MIQVSPPEASYNFFMHVRIVISIIVGLCITTLLGGLSRFIQHPKRDQVSLLHLGWSVALLLWVIHFWWWEYGLSTVSRWTFEGYFFVIFYAILFFMLCKLLFPDDLKGYAGYEEYLISRRRWFFGFFAATFLVDVIDTQLKGSAYFRHFGIEYPIRIAVSLTLCVIAMFTANRRYQLCFMLVSFAYQVSFILRMYHTQ